VYKICRTSDFSIFDGGVRATELSIDSDSSDGSFRTSCTRKKSRRNTNKDWCNISRKTIKINYVNRVILRRTSTIKKGEHDIENKNKKIELCKYRSLKLDIGNLEAAIRAERQKKDGHFRLCGPNDETVDEYDPNKMEEMITRKRRKEQELRDLCQEVDILKAQLSHNQDQEYDKQLLNSLNRLNRNWKWEDILINQYAFKVNKMNGILYNPKPYMIKSVGGKKIIQGDVKKHVLKCHYTTMECAVSILTGEEFWASKAGSWGPGFYISQYLPSESNGRDNICINSFGSRQNKEYKMPEWKYRRDSGCCDVGIMLCVPATIVLSHNEMTYDNNRIVEKIGDSPEDTVIFSLESKDLVKEGEVIDVKNTMQFKNILKNNKHTLIIIKFGAAWCGPSNRMQEVFKKLAKKYRSCVFLHVDVDEVELVAEEYSVSAMPTFVFLKRKNIPLPKSRIQGAYFEKLVKTIEDLSNEYSSCVFPGEGHSLIEKKSSDISEQGGRHNRNIWANETFVQKKLGQNKPQKELHSTKNIDNSPKRESRLNLAALNSERRKRQQKAMISPSADPEYKGRRPKNQGYQRQRKEVDLAADRRSRKNSWKCPICRDVYPVKDLKGMDFFVCLKCEKCFERKDLEI